MNKRIQIYILTIFISSCTFAEKVSSVCIPDSTVFNDILNCYLADYKKNDKILNSLYQKKYQHYLKKIKES